MERLSWLFIVTTGQGFFIALVLFIKKRNNPGNRLLAILLFLLSIELWLRFELYLNKESSVFSLMVLCESFGLIYGPVIYGYTLFASGYKKQIILSDLYHLIPAISLFIFNLFFYLIPDYYSASVAEQAELVKIHFTGDMDIYDYFISFGIMGSMLLYLFLSVILLRRYSKDCEDYFSEISKRKLQWLNWIISAVAVCIASDVIQTMSYMLKKSTIYHSLDFFTYFVICVILYISGYFALTRPEVFSFPEFVLDAAKQPKLTGEDTVSAGEDFSDNRKYVRTKLSENALIEISSEIVDEMEKEKLFLEPDLNIEDLSRAINTQAHYVSQAINSRFGQNFFMFINSYRIDEAKKLLTDETGRDKTILQIALESGFNSKTTFNSIFKKTTGMTPTEFKKQHYDLKE